MSFEDFASSIGYTKSWAWKFMRQHKLCEAYTGGGEK